MRLLLLMRHCKSSWDDDSLEDAERPLAERGKRDAVRMGEELARRGLAPDLAVTSRAKRARSTAKRVLRGAELELKATVDERLYGGGADRYRLAVEQAAPGAQRLLLIGHNPAIEEFAHWLTGQALAFSAGALAVIELPGSGGQLEAGQGRLRESFAPRDLPAIPKGMAAPAN